MHVGSRHVAMPTICPTCRQAIFPADVNVGADVAYCRPCAKAWKLSALINADGRLTSPLPTSAATGVALDEEALTQPPLVVSIQETARGFDLHASTRSPFALYLVPFTLVWSGGSMAAIFGSRSGTEDSNPMLALFGLPFLAGTIFLVSFTLMAVCGHVAVRVEDDRGEVFTGVGPVGWRKAFRWDEITSVQEAETSFSKNGQPVCVIQLDAPARRVSFGTGLNETRRYFVLQALRRLLARRRS